MAEEAAGSWFRGCRSATFPVFDSLSHLDDHIWCPRCINVPGIYLFSALLPSILNCKKNIRWKSSLSPQFHSNSAAQTLISVSGVNPHQPLNGTKTIMRIKLQRRDKAVHLACMAGSCLSNYSASQPQTEQKKRRKKKAVLARTCFSRSGRTRLLSRSRKTPAGHRRRDG